jgi:hypothetical protein
MLLKRSYPGGANTPEMKNSTPGDPSFLFEIRIVANQGYTCFVVVAQSSAIPSCLNRWASEPQASASQVWGRLFISIR